MLRIEAAITLIALSGMLSVSARAADATTTDTSAAAPSLSTAAPSAEDPNAIVCRRGQPVTGSRFPGPSQCRTRAEWDHLRQQSRDETMQQQNLGDMTQKPGS